MNDDFMERGIRYGMFLSIVFFLVLWAINAYAHDSWISKKGFRSPSGLSNPGVHCCGDNDCGYWDGRAGESIELLSDGYHVDATFQLQSNDAVTWKPGKEPKTTFHITQIIPENQTFPFSEDGMYWACVHWGNYLYRNQPNEEGFHGANPVRCFFAPPPGV